MGTVIEAKSSIKKKIIGYFLGILSATILLVVTGIVLQSRQKLLVEQRAKAEIVVSNLALACGDPMMVGEWERLSQILRETKKLDQDVEYAILTGNDSRCVVSTEARLVDQYLNKTDYENSLMKLAAFNILLPPEQKGVFEAVAPVLGGGEKMGLLRVGYNSRNISSIVRNTVVIAFLISIITLIIGSAIYYSMIGKSIIAPLNKVMGVAKKVAEGNLSQQEIHVASRDEIGQLGLIFNQMLRGLNGLVKRAEMISEGHIGAHLVEEKLGHGASLASAVTVTEDENAMSGDLANAFNKMQSELQKLTIQARRIATDYLNDDILNEKDHGRTGRGLQPDDHQPETTRKDR
ncbi:MAG: HAMP domain-containing protein [Endomicrobiales bacterium]